MERNVKFDEILEKIREYGIDYSLNDDEIDGCLLKSLYSWKIKNAKSFLLLNGQHNKVKVDKHKAKSNRVSKWLLACIIIVLISCLTVFYSDEITGFIFRFASTYVLYPLLRLIRVLSLPLITNFDLSGWFCHILLAIAWSLVIHLCIAKYRYNNLVFGKSSLHKSN